MGMMEKQEGDAMFVSLLITSGGWTSQRPMRAGRVAQYSPLPPNPP